MKTIIVKLFILWLLLVRIAGAATINYTPPPPPSWQSVADGHIAQTNGFFVKVAADKVSFTGGEYQLKIFGGTYDAAGDLFVEQIGTHRTMQPVVAGNTLVYPCAEQFDNGYASWVFNTKSDGFSKDLLFNGTAGHIIDASYDCLLLGGYNFEATGELRFYSGAEDTTGTPLIKGDIVDAWRIGWTNSAGKMTQYFDTPFAYKENDPIGTPAKTVFTDNGIFYVFDNWEDYIRLDPTIKFTQSAADIKVWASSVIPGSYAGTVFPDRFDLGNGARGLLAIDYSGLLGGYARANITKITLNANYSNSSPSGITYVSYPVTSAWDRATVTWNTKPAYSSTSLGLMPNLIGYTSGAYYDFDLSTNANSTYLAYANSCLANTSNWKMGACFVASSDGVLSSYYVRLSPTYSVAIEYITQTENTTAFRDGSNFYLFFNYGLMAAVTKNLYVYGSAGYAAANIVSASDFGTTSTVVVAAIPSGYTAIPFEAILNIPSTNIQVVSAVPYTPSASIPPTAAEITTAVWAANSRGSAVDTINARVNDYISNVDDNVWAYDSNGTDLNTILNRSVYLNEYITNIAAYVWAYDANGTEHNSMYNWMNTMQGRIDQTLSAQTTAIVNGVWNDAVDRAAGTKGQFLEDWNARQGYLDVAVSGDAARVWAYDSNGTEHNSMYTWMNTMQGRIDQTLTAQTAAINNNTNLVPASVWSTGSRGTYLDTIYTRMDQTLTAQTTAIVNGVWNDAVDRAASTKGQFLEDWNARQAYLDASVSGDAARVWAYDSNGTEHNSMYTWMNTMQGRIDQTLTAQTTAINNNTNLVPASVWSASSRGTTLDTIGSRIDQSLTTLDANLDANIDAVVNDIWNDAVDRAAGTKGQFLEDWNARQSYLDMAVSTANANVTNASNSLAVKISTVGTSVGTANTNIVNASASLGAKFNAVNVDLSPIKTRIFDATTTILNAMANLDLINTPTAWYEMMQEN